MSRTALYMKRLQAEKQSQPLSSSSSSSSSSSVYSTPSFLSPSLTPTTSTTPVSNLYQTLDQKQQQALSGKLLSSSSSTTSSPASPSSVFLRSSFSSSLPLSRSFYHSCSLSSETPLPGILHYKDSYLDRSHLEHLDEREQKRFFFIPPPDHSPLTQPLKLLIPSHPLHPLEQAGDRVRYRPYASSYFQNTYYRYEMDHEELSWMQEDDKEGNKKRLTIRRNSEEKGGGGEVDSWIIGPINGPNLQFQDARMEGHFWFARFPTPLHRGEVECFLPLDFALPNLAPTLLDLVSYFGKSSSSGPDSVVQEIVPLDLILPKERMATILSRMIPKEREGIPYRWIVVVCIALSSSRSMNIPFPIDIQLISQAQWKSVWKPVVWIPTKGVSSTFSNVFPTGHKIGAYSKEEESATREWKVLYHTPPEQAEDPEFTRYLPLNQEDLLEKIKDSRSFQSSVSQPHLPKRECYKIILPQYNKENPMQSADNVIQHIVMEEWWHLSALVKQATGDELRYESDQGSTPFVYIPVTIVESFLQKKFDRMDRRKHALDTSQDIVLRLTPHWEDPGTGGQQELIALLNKIRMDKEKSSQIPISFEVQLCLFGEGLEA